MCGRMRWRRDGETDCPDQVETESNRIIDDAVAGQRKRAGEKRVKTAGRWRYDLLRAGRDGIRRGTVTKGGACISRKHKGDKKATKLGRAEGSCALWPKLAIDVADS